MVDLKIILTREKKIYSKKYHAFNIMLHILAILIILILIGILLSSFIRKQFFVKTCIGKILPEITELPKEFTAIQGNQRNITCDVKSCLRDETRFQSLDRLQRYVSQVQEFSVNDGVLTFFYVPRSAKLEYRCRGLDECFQDGALLRLEVQVPPRIIQLGNLTREENSSATFECSAEGVPEPNLTIRKDGANVPFRSGDDRVKLVDYDKGGFIRALQLTIADVKRSDDGLYSCQASNAAGLAVKTVRLEVQFGPDMSLTPASVVKSWSSNPGNLTCIAEANPNASIVWKFRGVEIDRWDERYQILGTQSQSSLLVRTEDHEQFGEYTCEAKNRLGKNSTTITFLEAFAPGPVSEIIFDRVTPTSLTFKFQQPVNTGGLPITNYIMRYRMLTDSEERTADWTKGSAYVLSDLKPRKTYKFSVAARNEAGEGPWYSSGYIMPPEKVPDAPKLLIKCPLIRSNCVKLEWEVPEGNGRPVLRYEVRYFEITACKDSSSGKTGRTCPAVERTVRTPSIELTGLRPDTNYSVKVRAINEIGKSPIGYAVFKTSKSVSSTWSDMGYIFLCQIIGYWLFKLVCLLCKLGYKLYKFLRPTEKNRAFVISNGEDKRNKHGLFRV